MEQINFIILKYDCSVYDVSKHTTEDMVMACMAKYLSRTEFCEWLGTRDLKKKRRVICNICHNKCEKCILRNVGLPWPIFNEQP